METQGLKKCSKCHQEKIIACFYSLKTGKLSYNCKECARASVRMNWNKKGDQIRAKKRMWYAENKTRIRKQRKDWEIRTGYKQSKRPYYREYEKKTNLALREKVLFAYGHACACCGESKKEFLAIDHINGDGSEHRKRKNTQNIHREIIKLGFPKNIFRLLCHNCNQSMGYYGYCPHGNIENQNRLT